MHRGGLCGGEVENKQTGRGIAQQLGRLAHWKQPLHVLVCAKDVKRLRELVADERLDERL